MAEVVAPGSQDQTPQRSQRSQTQSLPLQRAAHGTKRSAETELEGEQRLSKRFDLLNLADKNGTRLYIPVAGSTDAAPSNTRSLPKPIAPWREKKRERRPRPPPADDSMQVEDTPNRVYIHDLAAELSDIESDEENPIFLVDIEKHLAKIPKHVLQGPELKPTKDNQLILYNVPSSLTVPSEQDRVRRAIVDARARIREKQAGTIAEPAPSVNRGGVVFGKPAEATLAAPCDPDAMDLD